MDELKEELKNALENLKPKNAKTPFYSTVEGKQIGGETLDAAFLISLVWCFQTEPCFLG